VNPKAREHRFRRLKEMGCIACWMEGNMNSQPEIHHLNLGGHAGQKRRGDEYTIPLCPWHHQGRRIGNATTLGMAQLLGPSMAITPRLFRVKYGRDDELLAKVNNLLRQMDELATVHHRSEAERSV
jgi:Recombination enhancement, RecA-dependent nuclease